MTKKNTSENIRLISAGAGSGKTYKISHLVLDHVKNGGSVSDIMVTTFTIAAAGELRERITQVLLESGLIQEAIKVDDAWIGTVHSLGKRLIDLFTFEAGYAPEQDVIPEEDETFVFGQILAQSIKEEDYIVLTTLAEEIGIPDWQQDILDVVKKARENNIDLTNFKSLSDGSFQVFEEIVYNPLKNSGSVDQQEIQKILEDGRNQMETLSSAKGYKQHLKICEKINELLNTLAQKNDQCLDVYQELAGLLKKDQKGHPERTPVFQNVKQMIDSCYAFFFLNKFEKPLPELVRTYLDKLFETAYNAYDAYIKYKKERGLMDFSDQENEFLKLLGNETVIGYLENKFNLLLVDEFQDTNPMQLAIFMKLSKYISKVFYVGDPKQSIYAFRGADPLLTSHIFKSIKQDEPLNTSRRSRHSLVDFTNHIFTQLFPDEDASLGKWENLKDDPHHASPVQIWQTNSGRSAARRCQSVVEHLQKLIDEDPPVFRDKISGSIKSLKYGNIAILCKSNADVTTWAGELESAGIAVSAVRGSLEKQAEFVFLMAALAYIADPSNSLAITELLVLGDKELAGNIEKIIDHRMEFLIDQDEYDPWMTKNEIILKLSEFSKYAAQLGVKELIEQLIIQLDIYTLAEAWGNAAVRKANLQKMIRMAGEYESQCLIWSTAISVQGFILWIKNKDTIDQQPSSSGNAVTVMTYHKAKGLEWPMVIMDGLNQNPNHTWWGISVTTDFDDFDIYEPLKSRQLYYIINPFGLQYDRLKGVNTCKQAPEFLLPEILSQDLPMMGETLKNAENIRKMYVGITRARDYLVLPSPIGYSSGCWWDMTVERVIPGFFSNSSDFNIGKTVIEVKQLNPPAEYVQNASDVYYFQEVSTHNTQKLPKFINPSKIEVVEREDSDKKYHFIVKKEFEHERLTGSFNEKDLGDAVHAVMASWNINDDPKSRVKSIQKIMAAYNLEDFEYGKMDKLISAFQDWIEEHFPEAKIYKEIPLRLSEEGHIYSGIADLLIETQENYFLIDYKSFQGTDVLSHSKNYIPQLKAYEKMLSSLNGKKVAGKFLFYPVSGIVVEMKNE